MTTTHAVDVNVPSTEWRESVAPDEEAQFARYAEQFVEFQRRRSRRYGPGRALHRHQILALRARVEVLADLPAHARHGMFAAPVARDAWIRLSSASMSVRPDSVPDIRGYSIKVLGVRGPGALGGVTDEQNFALINLPSFQSGSSREFVGLIVALSHGTSAAFQHLVRTYGLIGGIRRIRHGTALLKRRFSGFATESFYSAAPIACGPYAARVRLRPAAADADPGASSDWAGDMRRRLGRGPLVHDLQLQFFTDERTTPIENASVDWPESRAPYLTVARVTIPSQPLDDDAARDLAARVEASKFDPWNALMDHRPLGDVMRARKVVYYASQKERGLG
jgi:hypothetical protein